MGRPSVFFYEVTDTQTGEVFRGGSYDVGKRLDSSASMINSYAKKLPKKGKKKPFKNRWTIVRIDDLVQIREDKPADYSEFYQQKLRQLHDDGNRAKCCALYDSYTSGRSDVWSLVAIAEEFNVTVNDIRKVLKEEGKL